MNVEAYLFFEGRTDEAIEFYREALGAKVDFLMRYSESPEPYDPNMVPPGSENKVMHANLRIGDTQVMMSDGGCQQQTKFSGFSLTLNVATAADAARAFAALGAGGQVQMPLTKTFFSPSFGMVADKFGVSWMVIVPQAM